MKKIKPLLISILIIIFVIILDFITVNNTKNTVKYLNKKLEDIDYLLSQGEIPTDKTDELVEEWEKSSVLLSYYLEHDEIEKIGGNIFLIQKQIEIEEIEDARESITETKFLFDHIEQKQILNIENFF